MTFAIPVLSAFPTHNNDALPTRQLAIAGTLKKLTGAMVLNKLPLTLGGVMQQLTGSILLNPDVLPETSSTTEPPILTTDAFATTEPGNPFWWAYGHSITQHLGLRIPEGTSDSTDKLYLFVYRTDSQTPPLTPVGFTAVDSQAMTIAGCWTFEGTASDIDPSLSVINGDSFINLDLQGVEGRALAYIVRIPAAATLQTAHFIASDSNAVNISSSAVFTGLPTTSIFFASSGNISATPSGMTTVDTRSDAFGDAYLSYDNFFHGSSSGALTYGIDGGRRGGWLLTFDGVWDPSNIFATTEDFPFTTTEPPVTTTEPPFVTTTEPPVTTEPPTGPHRYWRIEIDQSGGDSDHIALLFHIGLLVGGMEVTDNTMTATASSTYVGSDFDPSFALTPTQMNGWASGGSAAGHDVPQWWQVDLGLGNEQTIDAVQMRPQRRDRSPYNWKVLFSDDASTWTVAKYFYAVTSAWGADNSEQTFSLLGHRYWRWDFADNNGFSTASPHGHSGVTTIITTAGLLVGATEESSSTTPATASSTYPTAFPTIYDPQWPFNPPNSGGWANDSDGASWLAVDLGADFIIDGFYISPQMVSAAPNHFTLSSSDSSSGPWNVEGTYSASSGWADLTRRDFTVP